MDKKQIEKAASLACGLRSLLEEIYEDTRYDHIGLPGIIQDLAADANEIECRLDEIVESL